MHPSPCASLPRHPRVLAVVSFALLASACHRTPAGSPAIDIRDAGPDVADAGPSIEPPRGWTNYTAPGKVYAFAAHAGALWVGTEGGLVRIDDATGERTFLTKANSGLPSNVITCLVSVGDALWIGTADGLAQYRAGAWYVTHADPAGLRFRGISALTPDGAGGFWFGTQFECASDVPCPNLVHFDAAHWSNYVTGDPLLAANGIPSIAIDASGTVWIGASWGLGRVAGDKVELEITATLSGTINGLAVDGRGRLWATTNSGLAVRDGSTGAWTRYTAQNSALPSDVVLRASSTPTGRVLLATCDGVAIVDGDAWTVERPPGLEGQCAFAVHEAGGRVWAGYEGRAWSHGDTWREEPVANSGLPVNEVYRIARDGAGDLWFATWRGLARLHGTQWQVWHAQAGRLPTDFLTCLAVDAHGTLWIGTRDRGLVEYAPASDTWTVHDRASGAVPSNEITDVLVDSGGRVWAATTYGGVAMREGTRWTTFDRAHGQLPTNRVLSVAEGANGVIWMADGAWTEDGVDFTTGGLVKYDHGTWSVFDASNSGLPFQTLPDGRKIVNLIAVAATPDGAIWAGAGGMNGPRDEYAGGVARFDGSDWQVFTRESGALPSNYVQTISRGEGEVVWVGIYGGLARYRGGAWTQYTTRNSGLGHDVVWALLPDGKAIWIATGFGGVSVFNESR